VGVPPRNGAACLAAPYRAADPGSRRSGRTTRALATLGLRAVPTSKLPHRRRRRRPPATPDRATAAAHAHNAAPLAPTRPRWQGLDGAGRFSPRTEVSPHAARGASTPARASALVAARGGGGGRGARGARASSGAAAPAPRTRARLGAVARECGAPGARRCIGMGGGACACRAHAACLGRRRGEAAPCVEPPCGTDAAIGARAVAARRGARGAAPRAHSAPPGAASDAAVMRLPPPWALR